MENFTFILIISAVVLAAIVFSIIYIKKETKKLTKEEREGSAFNLIKQDLREIREEIKESREKKIGRSPKNKRAKRKGVWGKEFLPFCD